MELKFRNAIPQKLIWALFFSGAVIVLFFISLILFFISGTYETESLLRAVIVFSCLLFAIWLLVFFSIFIFGKIVVITEKKIVLKKGKKIVWSIKKDEVSDFSYSRIFFHKNFYPEAGYLYFTLKNGKCCKRKIFGFTLVENCVGLSFKNVKKIIELGYVININN
ncbi:MAG TPA: hypothetical protein DDW54_02070 [Clostridiales bacterium]|nr:hypothetical protein [Clostridiales bacterium]